MEMIKLIRFLFFVFLMRFKIRIGVNFSEKKTLALVRVPHHVNEMKRKRYVLQRSYEQPIQWVRLLVVNTFFTCQHKRYKIIYNKLFWNR